MTLFLDTYALVEFAYGNPRFANMIDNEVCTLVENIAEMYLIILRKHNEKTANYFLSVLSKITTQFPIELVPQSMKFRNLHKTKHFSYIDAFGYTYALEHNIPFVTGDMAFKGLPGVKIIR